MEFSHIPVLLYECINGLMIRPDGIYLDGTAGGGGHSEEIAKRLKNGRLISLDQDPDAVETASRRLAPYPQATVVHANFRDMEEVLRSLSIRQIDGVLLDLGVSSYQLDAAERGFSYQKDAPLDMRMSKTGKSAKDFVNLAPEEEIARVLFEYGEERYARRIASKIVYKRQEKPLETTLELAEIIKSAVPSASRREKNPAKRSFQAIRIAVNGELDALKEGLEAAFRVLKPEGRLAVITFHSLEDRIVKQAFAAYAKGCECPPDFPVCVCGKTPRAKLINRKPILPSEEEMEQNRRSQSAKLRVLEKIKDEP